MTLGHVPRKKSKLTLKSNALTVRSAEALNNFPLYGCKKKEYTVESLVLEY